MTKGCKILSIELPEEVLHQLTSEAQAPPFLGNRSKYARGILEQRDEKTIVISPPAQAQADHYEQQLAQQAQQHQQQVDELRQAQQQQLAQQARDFHQQLDQQARLHAQQGEAQAKRHQHQLDGQAQRLEERNQELLRHQDALLKQQQAYDELRASHLQLALKQARTEFTQEADAKKQAEQTEQLAALTQAHKKLQAQYHEDRKDKRWLDLTTTIIEKNPALVQAGLGGLGNLFGGKAAEPSAAKPAAAASSSATKLVEQIIKDFPGPALGPMTDILGYLRDMPKAKERLLAQPDFMAYQTKLRAKAAGGNHK